MFKKIHNYVLPSLFCICLVLSFVFDAQRSVVLILSIIALAIVTVMSFVFLFNSVYKQPSYPIIFIAVIMLLFGNGKYNFEVDTISSNNYGYILLTIALVFSLYKVYRNHLQIKDSIMDFIIYIIVFLVLFTGCETYFNYAFDTSKEKHADLIIEQQIDTGHGLPGYDYVFIEYKVKTNDFNIETIDITEQYKLYPGDKVKIVYREGVSTPLYSTEYDVSMWLPSSIFSD